MELNYNIMSNLIKFGAKSTSNFATPVACNESGALIIERSWKNRESIIFNSVPVGTETALCDLSKNGLLSLRIINSTNSRIQISLCSDLAPAQDIHDFGWVTGLLQSADGFTNVYAGNDYQKSFICTPDIVLLTEDLSIYVDSGVLTIPVFETGTYAGRYQTINAGEQKTMSAGTYCKFSFNPTDSDRTIGVDHQLAKIHQVIDATPMYGINDGQYVVDIPANLPNRIYCISPNDWPILNYLEKVFLSITPESTITTGAVKIVALLKD